MKTVLSNKNFKPLWRILSIHQNTQENVIKTKRSSHNCLMGTFNKRIMSNTGDSSCSLLSILKKIQMSHSWWKHLVLIYQRGASGHERSLPRWTSVMKSGGGGNGSVTWLRACAISVLYFCKKSLPCIKDRGACSCLTCVRTLADLGQNIP